MNEAERVRLYNDLIDFKDDLQQISYPPQTRNIDILKRAIEYVRGSSAHWTPAKDATADIIDRHPVVYPCQCSSCHFAYGRSDFKLCPSCGAVMRTR